MPLMAMASKPKSMRGRSRPVRSRAKAGRSCSTMDRTAASDLAVSGSDQLMLSQSVICTCVSGGSVAIACSTTTAALSAPVSGGGLPVRASRGSGLPAATHAARSASTRFLAHRPRARWTTATPANSTATAAPPRVSHQNRGGVAGSSWIALRVTSSMSSIIRRGRESCPPLEAGSQPAPSATGRRLRRPVPDASVNRRHWSARKPTSGTRSRVVKQALREVALWRIALHCRRR